VHKFFALLVFVTLASACVTGSGGGDRQGATFTSGDLAEASADPAPVWTRLGTSRWHGGDSERFVYERLRLPDLPLGLKQAQLASLDESRASLAKHASALALDGMGTFDGNLSAAAKAELDRQAVAATESVHARSAKVEGVYYERFEVDGGSDEYRVLVLVQMPKGTINAVMTDLAARLARSSDPVLRKLGPKLKRLS